MYCFTPFPPSTEKDHGDLLQRLKTIEQGISKFQSFDQLPSAAELLASRRSLEDPSARDIATEERPAMNNDAEGGRGVEGGENKEQYLHNSWNTVRVNKRLQALEDGVDKLFSMLDILTAGHNELKNKKTNVPVDNENINKLREEIEMLKKGVSDKKDGEGINMGIAGLKESFETELAKLKKNIDNIEEKLNDKIDTLNSNFDKRLNDIEGKYGSSVSHADEDASANERPGFDEELKKTLLEMKNFMKSDRWQDFASRVKTLEDEVAKINGKLGGFVTRKEIEDAVRWPELEEALNVRGMGKEKRDEEDNDKNEAKQKEEVKIKEEKDDKIDVKSSKEEDQGKEEDNRQEEGERTLDENQAKLVVNEDHSEDKGLHTPSHPSPEMRECLRRISNLASLFGTMESRFDSILSDNGAAERNMEDIKREVQGEHLFRL